MANKGRTVDYLTLAGIALSLIAVIGGNLLEGGHTGSLIQLTAFVIVFGGTMGAILVQTPLRVFLLALRRLKWVVLPPVTESTETLRKITNWSKIVRRDGLLGLQKSAEVERERFTRKGLLLLVDGNEPEEIRKILEVEIDSGVTREMGAARVFEAMGGLFAHYRHYWRGDGVDTCHEQPGGPLRAGGGYRGSLRRDHLRRGFCQFPVPADRQQAQITHR